EQRRTEVAVIRRRVITKLNGFVVTVDGLAVFLPDVKDHTQIVVGIGITAIGFDRVLKVLLRILPALDQQVGNSNLVVKRGVVGFLRQRCLIVILRIEVKLPGS